MESKASTLLMTHKKAPLMVVYYVLLCFIVAMAYKLESMESIWRILLSLLGTVLMSL